MREFKWRQLLASDLNDLWVTDSVIFSFNPSKLSYLQTPRFLVIFLSFFYCNQHHVDWIRNAINCWRVSICYRFTRDWNLYMRILKSVIITCSSIGLWILYVFTLNGKIKCVCYLIVFYSRKQKHTSSKYISAVKIGGPIAESSVHKQFSSFRIVKFH